MRTANWILVGLVCVGVSGCYRMLPSDGGGQTSFSPPRETLASDVALPPGYQIEIVATGLNYPTGVTFDDAGTAYVVESGYAYGEEWAVPRLLRINQDGSVTETARGGDNGPWNGVTYANGNFYIAEGGVLEGGRILRIDPDGTVSSLIEDLPSKGDHHTNGPLIGADGKIYFGQGTATNSGVVGEDSAQFGWLQRFPKFHDTPCEDIVLTGENFRTPALLDQGKRREVLTGAFLPFGNPSLAGQIVAGKLPCNGAIMRINTDGSDLELVAWGFRNPYGLAFDANGQLYATDNGYDDRGSRPLWGTGDYLWRVATNIWHGWPDYTGGKPMNNERFSPPGKTKPPLLLHQPPNQPPRPVATLGVHASANGLDFSRSSDFGYVGQAFIAEFGDMSPDTGKSLHPVGFRVVRVNVETTAIEVFAINKAEASGPASKLGTAGLERPIAVRFDPAGTALYLVDFGIMVMGDEGPKPQSGTGVLWKITRQGAQ